MHHVCFLKELGFIFIDIDVLVRHAWCLEHLGQHRLKLQVNVGAELVEVGITGEVIFNQPFR